MKTIFDLNGSQLSIFRLDFEPLQINLFEQYFFGFRIFIIDFLIIVQNTLDLELTIFIDRNFNVPEVFNFVDTNIISVYFTLNALNPEKVK